MDSLFGQKQNRSNLVQFRKSRRTGKNRSPLLSRQEQRELLRAQRGGESPRRWSALTNPLTHLVKLCAWGAHGIRQIFQTTLRIAYSIVLLAALGLLGVGSLLAFLASGKVPHGYWDALWHGESVLLMFFAAGFLLDIALRTVPDLFTHQLVKRKSL